MTNEYLKKKIDVNSFIVSIHYHTILLQFSMGTKSLRVAFRRRHQLYLVCYLTGPNDEAPGGLWPINSTNYSKKLKYTWIYIALDWLDTPTPGVNGVFLSWGTSLSDPTQVVLNTLFPGGHPGRGTQLWSYLHLH